MNQRLTACVAAALLMSAAVAPAVAAPPTAAPSPGYDARLQESRKAAAASPSMVVNRAPPHASVVSRRHVKRKH